MGECTSAQLADKIGKNKRTVQRRMEKFEDSGRVTHRTGENGTKIWSIPQAEK
jgi:DNA-binding Lrp family transcriptional regulator